MKLIKDFINDESAQGATEYILILVAIVALAAIFREKLMEVANNLIEDLGSKVSGFTSQ